MSISLYSKLQTTLYTTIYSYNRVIERKQQNHCYSCLRSGVLLSAPMCYIVEVKNSWSWFMCDLYLTSWSDNTRTPKIVYAPPMLKSFSFIPLLLKAPLQSSSAWRETAEFKWKKGNQTIRDCSDGPGSCLFRKRSWNRSSYGGRRHRWHGGSKASENARIQVPPDAAHCSDLK